MFRMLLLLTLCLLFEISWCQDVDLTICPHGLTTAPSDPPWPVMIPNHFEFSSEISMEYETFEVTQLFLGPYKDAIFFHDYKSNLQTYSDFETNERLIINEQMQCDRNVIQSNEYLPFSNGQIVKPSILLGFDGRNIYNNEFYTRYVGTATIRDGISTKKFQSCFYLAEENLTINATYYISDPPPNQVTINNIPDFVQIDVRSNSFDYTFNVIRFVSPHALNIRTPSGVYCPDRIITKEIPQNLPSSLFIHAEVFTLNSSDGASVIESYNRLLDETLKFELSDYSSGQVGPSSSPSRALIDYATNLTYLYTRETQQCEAMNISNNPMGSTNEILVQFGAPNNSIRFQYTGMTHCGREHVQCHRWIGQRDVNTFIQQYEWYWSARYNDIDLQELIPIKVNMQTISTVASRATIIQEISFFDYNPSPNSMGVIDSTIAQCYRALGPSHHFNYAILRITFNNDAQYPVHRHLLSLQNRLHLQLAIDLHIRHVRLSSFVIDTTRDTTNQQDKNVHVTFTLLDNPPAASNSLSEPSSLELIRQLAKQINDGNFHVRDNDGAFDLQARPNSLRTLVLYLLPSENHTNYFNQTVFVYHDVTQTVINQTEKRIYKHTGSQIIALWTAFALLGIVVALAIGSFIAIRKWTPIVNYQRT